MRPPEKGVTGEFFAKFRAFNKKGRRGGPVWPPVKRRKVFINYRLIKYFPLRAKPAKRAQWAKQREQKGTPKNAVFWGRGEADKRLRNTAKRCSEKSESCRDEAPRSKYSRRMPQNILGTARVQWRGRAVTKGCLSPSHSFLFAGFFINYRLKLME